MNITFILTRSKTRFEQLRYFLPNCGYGCHNTQTWEEVERIVDILKTLQLRPINGQIVVSQEAFDTISKLVFDHFSSNRFPVLFFVDLDLRLSITGRDFYAIVKYVFEKMIGKVPMHFKFVHLMEEDKLMELNSDERSVLWFSGVPLTQQVERRFLKSLSEAQPVSRKRTERMVAYEPNDYRRFLRMYTPL